MNSLGIQVAFTLPLSLPLVFIAASHRHSLFYPAFMILLGAHYLPFIFMYGMWQFGVLAAFLLSSGFLLGFYLPTPIPTGGWITAGALFVFALVGRRTALQR